MSETEAPAPSVVSQGQPRERVIDAATVLAYLREHRDFFVEYPDLVPLLRLPNGSVPVAISGGLANVLRQRNSNLRIRLQDLEDNARSNELLFQQTRDVSLTLIDAQTTDALEAALRDVVAPVCNAQEVAIYLPPRDDFSASGARQKVGSLLRRAQLPAALAKLVDGFGQRHSAQTGQLAVRCTALRERELDELFPLRESRGNGSAALLPLARNAGVLAFGSTDSTHFDQNSGMLFLSYVGELIDHALDRIRR
ncbi:MAG: DUF484 family protein [Pseudomonadota bacterium]